MKPLSFFLGVVQERPEDFKVTQSREQYKTNAINNYCRDRVNDNKKRGCNQPVAAP
jgi:hypothetical protein